MQLRPYQTRAIEQLYDWFSCNPTGNPVLNMPGGSGKSVVIASIIKDAIQNWPGTRVLMLVHSRELVAQNAEKLRTLWPNAPMGIYSASLNKRQLGEPITYAGIQSVHSKAHLLGHQDIVIVDESHAISHTETGTYRKLLADLTAINPALRIIGFSASPYRLGHGIITDGDEALFKEIIEPVTINELIYHGHLVPLRSKLTSHRLDAQGLHKRGGDYIASEMEQRFNTDDHNTHIAAEIASLAHDRKHWLIFCSGVAHAEAFSNSLNQIGITSHWLTANDPPSIRDAKLKDFESGQVRAMCNVGILTTGYDFPALDCIAFLRATQSPGLYLQCAVRGMRPHPDKQDCLVLDFAGVVQTHGPITGVNAPDKTGEGNGEAPVKVCDNCNELCHPTVKQCPNCGWEFPEPKPKTLMLHNDDIMGNELQEMSVSSWSWKRHTSQKSGKDMCLITYYGALSDPPVKEYLTIAHEGYAGKKAMALLVSMAENAKTFIAGVRNIDQLCDIMNEGLYPKSIHYRKNGKFFEVINRAW